MASNSWFDIPRTTGTALRSLLEACSWPGRCGLAAGEDVLPEDLTAHGCELVQYHGLPWQGSCRKWKLWVFRNFLCHAMHPVARQVVDDAVASGCTDQQAPPGLLGILPCES